MKTGYVYIISNKNRTTLYIGATSNIERRIHQHRTGYYEKAFSKKYNLHELLYYETLPTIAQALAREKQLKNWHRDWKWNLIKEQNPTLQDLAADWFEE